MGIKEAYKKICDWENDTMSDLDYLVNKINSESFSRYRDTYKLLLKEASVLVCVKTIIEEECPEVLEVNDGD